MRLGGNYFVFDATKASQIVGMIKARWVARLSDYLNAGRVPSDLDLSRASSGFVQQGNLHLSRRKWYPTESQTNAKRCRGADSGRGRVRLTLWVKWKKIRNKVRVVEPGKLQKEMPACERSREGKRGNILGIQTP